MKKSKFPYILGVAAFATAAVAAWFSVTGLGKLFAGAAISVMIMAGVLEFAKLVVASYVYRYWNKIKFLEKTYLIIALSILMTITSAGIYGYLSGAYSETSSKLQISNGEISLLDKKKEQFKQRIENTEENIGKKNIRITSLNNLRTSQEVRLDSLYARKSYRQAKIVETQIKDADSEIKKLTKETDSLLNVVNLYNEEISKLDLDVTGKEADNLKGDTAPLQYIASLFGTNMDKVVNFFMFLLIFVCDPLAIMLVIATNKSLLENTSEEKTTVQEVVKTIEPNPVVEPLKKVEYKSNEHGEFVQQEPEEVINKEEALQILEAIKSQNIEGNKLYLTFVEALYLNGALKIGDLLPPFVKFTEELNSRGVVYEEKEVMDFLTICNLLKITDMSGPDRRVAKDYNVAKGIFNILSSK
jgi:hypothetical protein